MSISSIATRIGIALDPHTRNFIHSELTIRRNEMWAQGCSRLLEDEIIEGLMDDLYECSSTNANQSNTLEPTELDTY
jgi:hypothetical protein